MPFRLRHTAGITSLVAVLGLTGSAHLWAIHRDTEEDLTPRIEHEHNPIKKAKYEIRLARLKLLRGAGACQKDDHEACHFNLSSYLELMRDSWRDLKSSGRPAARQPAGFKELDIALREDARTLDDSKRMVPFEDQGAIDGVIHEMDAIHGKVFQALFPGNQSNTLAKSDAKSSGHPPGGGNP